MIINRRQILKLGSLSALAVFMPSLISAKTISNVSTPKNVLLEPQLDGNVTFNAGWVVPLEDKSQLLELESKKSKEKEEAAKRKAGESSQGNSAKDKSKSLSDRFQNIWAKVKDFF
jgi:hypothetical protein